MRREHDHEPSDAQHDGTGQRHWRRGNAGRIAAGLLTSPMQISAVDLAECSKRRSQPEAVQTF
jgi:hypothetical protein